MPGFNIGGGSSGRQKSNTAEPRRKHRWLVTKLGDVLEGGDLVYLQKSARPNFKYEEPEMHHDQEVSYFAGKQSWEPITFTFYDIEQPRDVSAKLYQWVTTITSSFQNAGAETAVEVPGDYKVEATVQMTDGKGRASETWQLYGAWPKETNWNDLDYTNTEIQLVEVVVRFDKATPSKQQTGAGT